MVYARKTPKSALKGIKHAKSKNYEHVKQVYSARAAQSLPYNSR
jgi:hypothetical protein